MEMKPEIEELFKVVSTVDNLNEAKNILNVFLKGYKEQERKEILTELEKRNSRFIGWDSIYRIFYPMGTVKHNYIRLKKPYSDMVISGKYTVELIIREVL